MAVPMRLSVLGLVLLVTACGTESVSEEPLPPPLHVARQVSSDMAALITAVDSFGLDLLAAPALADKPNLVVSPVSVSEALQMVGAGAAGETAAQINKVLHLPEGVRPRLPAVDQTDL